MGLAVLLFQWAAQQAWAAASFGLGKAPTHTERCTDVAWKTPPLVEWLCDRDFSQIILETNLLFLVMNVLAGRMDRLWFNVALSRMLELPQGSHFNLDLTSRISASSANLILQSLQKSPFWL